MINMKDFAEVLKKMLPSPIKRVLKRAYRGFQMDDYAHFSWGQEGEDMILRKLFCDKKRGFYVDIGAHHPLRFSNTQYFYLQGWNGINVDALPGSMEVFQRMRKRDINLEMGVGEEEHWAEYYMFNDPALNGFSKEISNIRDSQPDKYKIINTCKVKILPLETILQKYLTSGQKIDFLSIDVEGMDLMVLRSNDWQIFRPRCVLVEILSANLQELVNHSIVNFMNQNGYYVYAKSGNTVFFVDTQ